MSDKILEIRTALAVQDYRFMLTDILYLLDEYDKLTDTNKILKKQVNILTKAMNELLDGWNTNGDFYDYLINDALNKIKDMKND